MAPIPSSKWPQEMKIEKSLIRIPHSIDAMTLLAYLLSSGERSRAIMALLLFFDATGRKA